ncbi:MAG TPA: class II fructose-bisphosphate aldolase [Firmicutes bacterium]|jgi:fructose-bisphosphate aldolase class II|nr:class II fructose-bisphosphate aldolase [Bacillota bacterium]
MALVPLQELLQDARKGGYAVGQFNFSTMEFAQATLAVAAKERAPFILGVTEGGIKHMGVEFAAAVGKTVAQLTDLPVVLHLDHGSDFDVIMRCLRAGFTSVMFDGSRYPLEENIARTKEIVRIAHSMGASVEAEVGVVGGVEDDHSVDEADALVTDPRDARRIAEETGIDALAIAVGNAHGMYKSIPNIRTDVIAATAAVTDVPLVLHGGSGIPDELVRAAIAAGICKVNVSTEFQLAFTSTLRDVLTADPKLQDSRKCLGPARDAIKAVVAEKIKLFGIAGRA